MEAIDTVMSEKEWLKIWYSGDDKKHLKVYDDYLSGLINQAEISFPKGIDKGRKEVVEWIEEHQTHIGGGNQMFNLVLGQDWQAKLKEWGL